jgi:hypothetical protein
MVFTAEADSRTVKTSDEGTLEWVPKNNILEKDLVEDLPYLLPRILQDDGIFSAHTSYDDNDNIIFRFAI